jgi:DNA primase
VAFPAAFLDELVARNPIEDVVGQYVSLTRRGGNLFGLCPFHSEKTASFSVAPDKGIYYCFGCHKGGGVINFIEEQEGLDFPDAVRFLAQRAGMEVPDNDSYGSTYKRKERLWALCRDAARYFHSCLQDEQRGAPGRAYLAQRGLPKAIQTRFGIGYAPDGWSNLIDAMAQKGYEKQDLLDAGLAVKSREKGSIYDRFRNRVMFPIIDVRGNIIGFGGRVLGDGEPKYLNSPETIIFNKRKNLFALNIAKKSKQGRLILTEGYMDAITLHQFGFDCAVASLGTSLTEEHVTLLSKYTKEVVITYDADAAGQNATQRAISLLEQSGVQVRILRMQGAKDPDEYLKKFGADRFRLLLDQTANPVEYQLQAIQKQFDLTQDDQKAEFGKQAAQYLSKLSSAVERDLYGRQAAETAGISPEAMQQEIAVAYRRRKAAAKKQQEKKDLAPVAALQPKARGLRYENPRSARAEEGLLRQLLTEPALFDRVSDLTPEQFSSELLGRAYGAFRALYEQGLNPSVSVLTEGFTPDEISHLSSVVQQGDGIVQSDAFDDYAATIRLESGLAQSKKEKNVKEMWDKLKQTKGYGG